MTDPRKCNMCLACDEDVCAELFCKQCKQYFCTDCENEHIVSPGSEKHTFVSAAQGVLLEIPKYCGICTKLNRSSKALRKCTKCQILLCDRCGRKHSANSVTGSHIQVEDLTENVEMEVVRTSVSEGLNLSVLAGGGQDLEDSSSGIKVETEYYIRFVLLLIKGGSSVLRNIFSWCLEKRKVNLELFLTSNRVSLNKSKTINRQQKEILYPDPPMTSDINNWDIQLLCFIILEFFSEQLNTPQQVAIKKIREMRNDFYAHHSNACIDRQTFFELTTELSLIITTMSEKMTESEREKNNKLISHFCSTKLDMNSATEEIKKLGRRDEFLENIQERLTGALGMNLLSVKQDLADIKAALNRIEGGEKYTKIVNTVYGAVHVHAREKSIVDKAEAELLAASNQGVDDTDETANSELTSNFNNFKREVEESGNKLTKSDMGSIIFSFESHSVSELIQLIDFFESKRIQFHMDEIAGSLQKIIGESIHLTAYILRDSLFEALRRIQCQEHKKSIWFNIECTGIEGLLHALKMFEESGASNSLNKLSEILTNSIGETITLESSIDMEQLKRTIVITKEQLALPSQSKGALLMSQFRDNSLENAESNSEKRMLGYVEPSGDRTDTYSRSKSFPEIEKHSQSRCENNENMENGRPGKPEAIAISSDTVSIIWQPPSKFGKEDYYQVYYTTDAENKKRKWRKCQTEPINNSVTLTELKTDATYTFRVKAVYGDEEGPYSQESERIKTPKSLALRLLHEATKIGDDKQCTEKYLLPMKEITSARNEINRTKKYEIGVAPKGYVKSKTILLVGATGTGKSTLVDGIANYVLGVNWEDPFRFSVLNLEEHEKERSANQAISQTDWITCYTINQEAGSRLKYQINVIDTPGFGDTGGPERDQEIASQLRKLFKEEKEPKGITYIDAACFLIKSSDARLTVFQEYIFKSVMALFGKDMETNICYFITFADNRSPPVLAAMSELGLPKGENFIFNNSGLFETNICKDATNAGSLFWKMGLQSFSLFFEYLERLQSRSLQQTKEVLEQRHKLEETVSQLQPLLDLGLSKVCSLKQEIKILEENCSKIKDSKNFAYEVEEMKKEKRELPSGVYATNCSICGITCHDKCIDEEKLIQSCCAFDSEGYCKKCPDKCHFSKHEIATYKLDFVQVKVKKEYENMRQKFEEASGKVLTQEQVIDRLGNELKIASEDMEYLMFVVKSCTDKLSAIALRPNPLNMIDYIDLIIENEKYDRKEGYQKRIKVLKEFRKKAEIQQQFEKFSEQASGLLNTIGQSKACLFTPAFERTKHFLP